MFTLENRDCLEGLKELGDGTVDLVLTDPPYGIEYQNNFTHEKHKKIENDDIVDYKTVGQECYRVLKENGHAYFFTRFDVYPKHYQDLVEAGFIIKNVLVIEKGNIGGLGDLKGSFSNNSEWIIFCQKGRRVFEDTKLVKNKKPAGKQVSSRGRPIKEYKTRFPSCWFGEEYPKSTYNAAYQNKHGLKHPTVKNVECLEWLIQLSSKEGEVVLDPFLGSGSTAVACKNTGRKCIGYEIDEGYYELILRRLEEGK